MDRYPLAIAIPRAEEARSNLFGFRHTDYIIKVDDCGYPYERQRRFTDFAWLHGMLRRRALACALPDLPPKKALGNLDQAFVERRRQMLEGYLRALLRLPQVVQDDAIWAFLDADAPTFLVPRFLCRRPDCEEAAAETLRDLEKVAAHEASVFRLCGTAALAELVAFARREAACEAPAPAEFGAPRTRARLSLCAVLRHLTGHGQARRGLIQAGMFGALLALFARTVDDAATSYSEVTRIVREAVLASLKQLLERTAGEAMLHFCHHDEAGLEALKPLAVASESWLHVVAASCLWRGLEQHGMSDALGSSQGLQLMGHLMRSPELCARLLASLCLGCILRLETSLDCAEREYCLQALLPLPAELDRAADDALGRVASATLDAPSERSLGEATRAAASSRPEAMLREQMDPQLVDLLRSLCVTRDLSRFQLLLGEGSDARDAVAAAAVAVLDHRLRHVAALGDDRSWCAAALAPQLRRSALGAADAEEGPAAAEVRFRAARVLSQLGGVCAASSGATAASAELPPLAEFAERVGVLHVLGAEASERYASAVARLEDVHVQSDALVHMVRECGLLAAPCLGADGLVAFGDCLGALRGDREQLAAVLERGERSQRAVQVCLEQRRLKHGVLAADAGELCDAVGALSEEEGRNDQCQQAFQEAEDRFRGAAAEVEGLAVRAREAEAHARDCAVRCRDIEARAAARTSQQTELTDIWHTAPAQLERLQQTCLAASRRRAALVERGKARAAEMERIDRGLKGLGEREREAENALRSLEALKKELAEFHGTLHSELILTDEDVAHLRTLELKMRPARPDRLRRRGGGSEEEGGGGCCSFESGRSAGSTGATNASQRSDGDVNSACGEVEECDEAPPAWNDNKVDQEFRASPHFRSFSRLRSLREKLWLAELRWTQRARVRVESLAKALREERLEGDREEQAASEEEEHLRQEIAALEDAAGQAACLEKAAAAAAEAQAAARRACDEAAEAEGFRQLAEGRLAQGQAEMRQVKVQLEEAQEQAAGEASRSVWARRELLARTRSLEARMRDFVEEWPAVALEEHRVALIGERVAAQMSSEARRRSELRGELHRLLEAFEHLEQQLGVEPGTDDSAWHQAHPSQP